MGNKQSTRPGLHVGSSARSFPFRIGGGVSSAPRENGENRSPARVGVAGWDEGSSDSASVKRNSTQRREKDWNKPLGAITLAREQCRVPPSRLSCRAPADAAEPVNWQQKQSWHPYAAVQHALVPRLTKRE